MKTLVFISCLLVASSAASDHNTVVITDAVFKEKFVIYTAQHDIVNIYVPFNSYNMGYDYPHVWFFVEADTKNADRIDQGLYVYKERRATKILTNGRDAVADNTNVIYFGASDGIYKYNKTSNSAEKYGNITDNIIQMAHDIVKDAIYYLTANNEVFKLNSDATASVKVPLENVKALAFGEEGNMYYYDTEKNVYVFSDVPNSSPRRITGLPSTINKITLVSPMTGMNEGSILLVDKAVYRPRRAKNHQLTFW